MKEIKGYEGLYSASKDGNIYRVGTVRKGEIHEVTPRVRKLHVNHGTLAVGLSKDSKIKQHQVGRVMWEAYVEELDREDVIKMKDGNILNARLDNLYKVSQSKVIKDSIEKGNFKQHITNLKKWGKLKEKENE